MCGIVAVLEAFEALEPVPLEPARSACEAALARLERGQGGLVDSVEAAGRLVAEAEALLRGLRGIASLARHRELIPVLERLLDGTWEHVARLEHDLDTGALRPADGDLERLNAAIVRLKDVVWRARRDALRLSRNAIDLAGANASPRTVALYGQIEIALSAIDRLEVRGRDSAGIAVLVWDHGLELDSPAVRALMGARLDDPLLRSGSVRAESGNLGFVYKAAAEVGDLGDNTRAIREAVAADPLLRQALAGTRARALVLGHTRWASVGMISEPNAHPVSSSAPPFVFAVLNGDIDNHADLASAEELRVAAEITTDAAIIPMLVAERLREGCGPLEAFRRTVASFEGSVAVAAVSLSLPDELYLALRGSGQALYVGLSRDGFLVSSEAYGFVEQADTYLRLDGEARSRPDVSSRGQIVVVRSGAGLDALRRITVDGTELPPRAADLRRAEITTRDVDRGPYRHFLLKEMTEAPRSLRQTLRGRLDVERDGVRVVLGDETLPPELVRRLEEGSIRRMVAVGQGSAAVAARSLGMVLGSALRPAPIVVEAVAATELSGFGLRPNMSDTLVVAISQSGTTADTNRTVEVVRARGAFVVSIVNRRQSDLVDRSHGVLYTSDGRDVEMAVPSTKAFYAQVAAGFLLAAAVAEHVRGARGVDPSALRALWELPEAMEAVLTLRPHIAEVAQRHAPPRRDWAVVGNGANRIAAEEVRIKLSELCYKSISCDATEDKKHIDLSAEPLILVCAAGLTGSNGEDVSREVVYYRAHKAAPIVIFGEGEARYDAALDVIVTPSVHPDVAFVLSTMAGHLFGYEAALAIDGLAGPLREARRVVEALTIEHRDPLALLEAAAPRLVPLHHRFQESLRAGHYDGHLEPSAAVRLASLFRYAAGLAPLEAYQVEFGKLGTPGEVLADFMGSLTVAIDKLTRPIDAIRHQAKTVTVGISRAEEDLLRVRLVREVLGAGVPRDRLTYRNLRALAALDAAVDKVLGYTHYRIEGDASGEAFIHVTDRGGIAREIPSRTDRDPSLRGTKHRVAVERELLVTRGHDGRTVIIVPEVKGPDTTGVALLHVRFCHRLPAPVMRSVLQGYRDRYSALRDLVTETEPTFREDLLGEIGVEDLLIDSIQALAGRWRA